MRLEGLEIGEEKNAVQILADPKERKQRIQGNINRRIKFLTPRDQNNNIKEKEED